MTKKYPVQAPLVTEVMGVFDSFRAARRNLLEIIPVIATQQPMVSGKTAIVRWHMVMDPTANRRVLKEKVDDYPKSDVTKNILEPAIGNSIFIAEGANWRWQRRAATPVFTQKGIELYIEQTAKVSLLDIIGVPTWVPRPGRLFSNGTMGDMQRLADEVIEARKENGAREVPDLLDLLLEGEDPETKRQMNTAELRDNLLTFIVAGHETTALTLAWALYLCGFDQSAQEKARQEACTVLGDRAATAEDINNLPYIRMIIDEALRLYPPAAIISRTAQAPDTLCDREIKKGDTVMLPIYALHRNELLWEEAAAFKPERFADRKSVDRFSYLPFGDGPRICIGASFALQEAVIILATLLARFKFTAVPGKDPEPVIILTLRPEGGVWMHVEPIDAPTQTSAV